MTGDTGYFWFFRSTNVEFLIKVLNACQFVNRYWVFAGGLTNVRVDYTVTDTATGAVRTYRNPQNSPFQPLQDTDAFRTCGSGFETGPDSSRNPLDVFGSVASALPPALELRQGRFRVSAVWSTPDGRVGAAHPVQLTEEAGYFWFFNPANVEMIVKVLDACGPGNRFWVFAAGLTNVSVETTVEDTWTGVRKRYSNPLGAPFVPLQDTAAFATCSDAGLPPDPGAAGKATLAGIDSDHDGVRDDLQRNIALTYAGSQPTISALRQMVMSLQHAILENGSETQSIENANQFVRDLECLGAVRPSDYRVVKGELLAMALNTEARGLAYLHYGDQLGGQGFSGKPPDDWASSCRFSLSGSEAGTPASSNVDAAAACPTSDKKVSVFFVNGVLNTPDDAEGSRSRLEVLLSSTLPAARFAEVEVVLAYNESHGVLQDGWEATRQLIDNNFSQYIRFILGLDYPLAPFQVALILVATQVDSEGLANSPDITDHLRLYRSAVFEGRKVILVAHSQGNLFANSAYRRLTSDEKDATGIVAIATPDTHVEDGRPYTTLSKDLVIRALPFALPANTSNDIGFFGFLADWTGHRFAESYLVPGSNSRTRILSHIVGARDSLEQPPVQGTEGAITVTLTWGAQPDVDLHVFEPTGDHVFYANPFGSVGFLDVDDTSGFGPEHYFAECVDLVPGTYAVGVNYYNGFAPETANIQVKAGPLLRSFVKHLANAVGPSGDNSPLFVANVVVTLTPQGNYDFQIQ